MYDVVNKEQQEARAEKERLEQINNQYFGPANPTSLACELVHTLYTLALGNVYIDDRVFEKIRKVFCIPDTIWNDLIKHCKERYTENDK